MVTKYSLVSFLFLFSLINSVYAQKATPRISYAQYIENFKSIAIRKMHEYKIPASITLAQGLLESGSGNSDLALYANNHFGIKCHKEWTGMTYIKDDDERNECFRKYASAEESFNDHSQFLTTRPRYSNLFKLDIHDYKGWAHGLKSAGYATNPKYAEMLIKIIEENQLFLYDRGYQPLDLIADKNQIVSKDPKLDYAMSAKAKPNHTYVEVTTGNRSIYVNNGVRLIYARSGDKAAVIANDLGIHTFQILQYNELGRDEEIKEGSVIYIEPKKRKSDKSYHILSEGETMRDVAQLYAVKLKVLYKRNDLKTGHEPATGTKIFLKKSR
jgi:hypothetical protein